MRHISDLLLSPLERLSESSLRITGSLKTVPADFVVEEIPIYTPSGEGEHLYLWIEKEDISADYLQQHLARTLNVHRNDIGVAGLKDRRAITRQWISVPVCAEEKVGEVDTDSIRVLEVNRHTNKLKTGHLKGNRFTLTLRDTQPDAFEKAELIRQRLLEKGVPNYFGAQRFGREGETLKTGHQLLIGELDPQSIQRQRRKFLTRLSLSAVQSAFFNVILSERIKKHLVQTVQKGDVLQVVASGGPFVSEEPEVDQLRFNTREVVTTGPLFGPKMKFPTGEVYEWELSFLAKYGLSIDAFSKHKKLTSGARRPCLLYLNALQLLEVENGLQLSFELPSGAYATVVMDEFLAPEAVLEKDA